MSDLTHSKKHFEVAELVEEILENPKLSIKYDGRYKSITPFNWENIPDFTVITGINGTGKSQLLELIHNTIINKPQEPERVVISGKNIGRHEVTFLKGEWQLDGTGRTTFGNIQSIRDGYYQNFKNTQNYHSLVNNQIRLYEAFQYVRNQTGKSPENVSEEEFHHFFPEVIIEHEHQLSTKISQIFVKYRLDEIDLLAKGGHPEAIYQNLGEKPWNVLRRIMQEAKLSFNINDPSQNCFGSMSNAV